MHGRPGFCPSYALSRKLALAIRITPMIDGYSVRVQAGRHDGPCPRFEKHFPADTPIGEALDIMAGYSLSFFQMGRGGVPPPR